MLEGRSPGGQDVLQFDAPSPARHCAGYVIHEKWNCSGIVYSAVVAPFRSVAGGMI